MDPLEPPTKWVSEQSSGSRGSPWVIGTTLGHSHPPRPAPQNVRTILLKGILDSNPVLTGGTVGPEKLSYSPKAKQLIMAEAGLNPAPRLRFQVHQSTKSRWNQNLVFVPCCIVFLLLTVTTKFISRNVYRIIHTYHWVRF